MIDKIASQMSEAGLFQENVIYPRRYYDDLILEQSIT